MTRFHVFGLFLLVALAVATPVAAQKQDNFEISGTIRTTDGKPVAGVTVTASYHPLWQWAERIPPPGSVKVVSDANGRFHAAVPKPLRFLNIFLETPETSALRLWSVTPPVSQVAPRIMSDKAIELDIRLKEGTAVLTGKITDEADKPVQGVAVTISRSDAGMSQGAFSVSQRFFHAASNADGVYRFDHLLSGSYNVVSVVPERGGGLVPMAGGWRGHGGVRVVRGTPATLDFSLRAGCSLSGHVLDEDGKPVEGVEVLANRAAAAIDGPAVYERSGNFHDDTTTDADGRYALEGLSPETYQVTVMPPAGSDFAPSHPLSGLRLEVGKPVICQDIILVQGASLEGRVAGADGKPLAGVAVWCGRHIVRTDAQGCFRMAGFPTSLVDVRVLPPDGSPWAAATAEGVPCVAKVRISCDVVLQEGGCVSGTVKGEDGKVIAGATVYTAFRDYRYTTTTDAEGRYRLVGLVENSGLDYNRQPNLYSVTALLPADSPYMSNSVRFSIKPGEKLTQDLTLKSGGTITGKVKTADGKPVAGASIGVFKELGRGSRSYFAGGMGSGRILTDSQGNFVVRQLPGGSMNVSADPPADANLLTEERKNVQVVAGESTPVDLTLKTAGSVAGTLTDASGKPIVDAEVTLSCKGPSSMPWGRSLTPVTTDEQGRYRFVGLAGGAYQVQVNIFDGKQVVPSQDLDVKAGAESALIFHACQGAFIEVKVLDPSGKPVTDAGVGATGQTPPIVSVWGRVPDKSGVTVVGPLLPGAYTLSVRSYRTEGRMLKPATLKDITVKEGERLTREVRLEEGAPLPPPGPAPKGRGGKPPGA